MVQSDPIRVPASRRRPCSLAIASMLAVTLVVGTGCKSRSEAGDEPAGGTHSQNEERPASEDDEPGTDPTSTRAHGTDGRAPDNDSNGPLFPNRKPYELAKASTQKQLTWCMPLPHLPRHSGVEPWPVLNCNHGRFTFHDGALAALETVAFPAFEDMPLDAVHIWRDVKFDPNATTWVGPYLLSNDGRWTPESNAPLEQNEWQMIYSGIPEGARLSAIHAVPDDGDPEATHWTVWAVSRSLKADAQERGLDRLLRGRFDVAEPDALSFETVLEDTATAFGFDRAPQFPAVAGLDRDHVLLGEHTEGDALVIVDAEGEPTAVELPDDPEPAKPTDDGGGFQKRCPWSMAIPALGGAAYVQRWGDIHRIDADGAHALELPGYTDLPARTAC